LNETALLVSFDNIIDETINDKVIHLHRKLHRINFNGFIESVPAYSSLAVFYDVWEIKNNSNIQTGTFDFVSAFITKLIHEADEEVQLKTKEHIFIPVYYDGEDLEYVAKQHKLSVGEVISIHSSGTYRVYMIGFLPGFAYMGKVDERIFTERLASPRTLVKAGAVGMAGFQTGVYPVDSPGGWRILGQTPLKIFDREKTIPCLLKAGDTIQFQSIEYETFKALNEY
jgi:inhibitor of KinA